MLASVNRRVRLSSTNVNITECGLTQSLPVSNVTRPKLIHSKTVQSFSRDRIPVIIKSITYTCVRFICAFIPSKSDKRFDWSRDWLHDWYSMMSTVFTYLYTAQWRQCQGRTMGCLSEMQSTYFSSGTPNPGLENLGLLTPDSDSLSWSKPDCKFDSRT